MSASLVRQLLVAGPDRLESDVVRMVRGRPRSAEDLGLVMKA